MALQPLTGDIAHRRSAVFAPLDSPSLVDDPWSAFIALTPDSTAPVSAVPPRLLEGVTFAVKNSIHAAGLATRAGSPAIDAAISSREAEIVRRLTAAGARCVGTLNMHELALGTSSANAFFGSVLNPAAPGRMAGGSSGGSAASVAAGLVSFALSTDTGGSSRIPASYCGVVGLRPTTGRYPSDGIITLAPSRDTAGVIASSVAQVALVDEVITGEADLLLPASSTLRLGVPLGHRLALSAEVAAAFDAAVAALTSRGVAVIELDPGVDHDPAAALAVVAWEAPRALLALRGVIPAGDDLTALQLADLADAVEEVASPDVRELLMRFVAEPISGPDYRAALARGAQVRAGFVDLIARAEVHALIYPTVPITAPPLGASAMAIDDTDHPLFPLSIRNTDPGAFAGLPSVTIPLPVPRGGSPVGLGIEGMPGRDREILGIAAVLEGLLTERSDRI